MNVPETVRRIVDAGQADAAAATRGSVPPAIAQALVGFAPPSSAVFDSLREPEEQLPMRAFVVCVRRQVGGAIVRHFEAMGRHAVDVTAQHADLAGIGERVHVMTAEAFALERKIQREADATQQLEIARMPMGGYFA